MLEYERMSLDTFIGSTKVLDARCFKTKILIGLFARTFARDAVSLFNSFVLSRLSQLVAVRDLQKEKMLH